MSILQCPFIQPAEISAYSQVTIVLPYKDQRGSILTGGLSDCFFPISLRTSFDTLQVAHDDREDGNVSRASKKREELFRFRAAWGGRGQGLAVATLQ